MCNSSMLKPEILYGYLYKPMGTEPMNKNIHIYLICINTYMYINYLKNTWHEYSFLHSNSMETRKVNTVQSNLYSKVTVGTEVMWLDRKRSLIHDCCQFRSVIILILLLKVLSYETTSKIYIYSFYLSKRYCKM